MLENKVCSFNLFLTNFIVYSGSFNVPFQFDDHNQISFRESVHSLDYFKNIDNWLKINERPFSFFTIAINYALHGEKVFGYHLFNLLVHILTGFFLFIFLGRIFKTTSENKNYSWLIFIISLYFLLQPVQTQSVTYIIQRMSAMAGLFLIISALLYFIGRTSYLKEDKKLKSLVILFLAVLSE